MQEECRSGMATISEINGSNVRFKQRRDVQDSRGEKIALEKEKNQE